MMMKDTVLAGLLLAGEAVVAVVREVLERAGAVLQRVRVVHDLQVRLLRLTEMYRQAQVNKTGIYRHCYLK